LNFAADASASFISVAEINDEYMAPAIVNGMVPADKNDYAAIFVLETEPGVFCTGTLVSSTAFVTAAHCIPQSKTINLTLLQNAIPAICTITDENYADPSYDWALCMLKKPISGLKYESISLDPARTNANRELSIAGFGCTDISGLGSGVFRVGKTIITKSRYLSDYLEITGGASLCPGDSGGPAFSPSDVNYVHRALVAINSQYFVNPLTGKSSTKSLLTSLSSPRAIEFIKSWSTSNHVALCGISAAAAGCRKP